jgi:hypothetical protein
VIQRIGEAWKSDRKGIIEHGETVLKQLQEYSGVSAQTAGMPGKEAITRPWSSSQKLR